MREKFKHFCDTANPDLLRLVIIFVLVGLLLVGFLLFGRSDEGASILPAWVQTEHVEPPDERLTVAQKENPDTVAWITIPGTNIDAPVQQYGDNDYYLLVTVDAERGEIIDHLEVGESNDNGRVSFRIDTAFNIERFSAETVYNETDNTKEEVYKEKLGSYQIGSDGKICDK